MVVAWEDIAGCAAASSWAEIGHDITNRVALKSQRDPLREGRGRLDQNALPVSTYRWRVVGEVGDPTIGLQRGELLSDLGRHGIHPSEACCLPLREPPRLQLDDPQRRIGHVQSAGVIDLRILALHSLRCRPPVRFTAGG